MVAMKRGSRSPVTVAKSLETAVTPPTWAVTPVSGMTSSRSRSMSWDVSSDCGDVVGTTWMRLTPCAGGRAVARATPSVASMSLRSAVLSPPPSTTTWSGPLKPGPKPSASRS